ncbi:N amino acid transport system protein [Decorospora gaudefroyi]|uniref:N amino acid transport system protein n=1 Tax=Decorospora gaudefroyi TaxID=184978 RepID=A0A6A5K5W6_9PLEO|nr:N amino acid transport system protein [Decorospora gaudefroyi]
MQEVPHANSLTTGNPQPYYATQPANGVDSSAPAPHYAGPPTYPLDDLSSDGKKSDPELAIPAEKTSTLQEGSEKFHRLGWKQLTVCLIVEAIALGSLSIPSAFATLGMVPGVIMCVGLGLVAIYTSYVVGQVKMRYPHVSHYSDAVEIIWGRFGKELAGVMFALFLILLVGSHALTGTIAFINIIGDYGTCALVWGVVSMIILLILALPPTFHDFAILGYIDFISIISAILITIIATGIQAHNAPGGLNAVNWSAWPAPGTSFYEAFLATTNIIFAYSFAVCQFSFMSEMHTPTDYVKSIWALGLIEIFIYTLTGALVYAFVGQNVGSPALLSAGDIVSRIAFGVALPVIFISGSINGTVVSRYIMDRVFTESPIRYVKDAKGWAVWFLLISIVTIIGWIIAEAIPFFNALLGLISSLFISGFTFYWPALFWFQLIKEGKWNISARNIALSVLNSCVLVIGLVVLGAGTYASVEDIITQYNSRAVRSPFTCSAVSYA